MKVFISSNLVQNNLFLLKLMICNVCVSSVVFFFGVCVYVCVFLIKQYETKNIRRKTLVMSPPQKKQEKNSDFCLFMSDDKGK